MRDEDIIKLYWDRDETAIAATAEVYAGYCYAVALRILNSEEDAEECVNDTLLRAWNAIPPHQPDHLAIYLGKISRNLALDRLKQMNAQKRGMGQVALALEELETCVPAALCMEQIADKLVLTKAIERFLLKYPEKDRRIFVGRYWYLYPIRDIAVAYRMSESKVTSLLFRMRKNLKRHLEKEDIYL